MTPFIQRKMKQETGRMEKRFPVVVPLSIRSFDRVWLAETAITENVSLFGARILVDNRWEAGERVVVESPEGADPFPAWVVYCQALKNGQTAIGVNLTKARPNWMSPNGR
jgi:hypothetical protein